MTTQIISQEKQAVREVAVIAATPNILPTILERTASNVFESFSDRLKASLNGRQDRALKLALNGHVTHKSARIYSVRSQRGQHTYLVNLDKSFCSCPDSRKGHVCKHRIASYLIEQASEATQEVSPELSAVRELQSGRGLDPDEEAVEKAPDGSSHADQDQSCHVVVVPSGFGHGCGLAGQPVGPTPRSIKTGRPNDPQSRGYRGIIQLYYDMFRRVELPGNTVSVTI